MFSKFQFSRTWFKGQDTSIVNRFLEERFRQLLAEEPSDYVAAIQETLSKANSMNAALVCSWALVSEVRCRSVRTACLRLPDGVLGRRLHGFVTTKNSFQVDTQIPCLESHS